VSGSGAGLHVSSQQFSVVFMPEWFNDHIRFTPYLPLLQPNLVIVMSPRLTHFAAVKHRLSV
jgi:hypothetical protein